MLEGRELELVVVAVDRLLEQELHLELDRHLAEVVDGQNYGPPFSLETACSR